MIYVDIGRHESSPREAAMAPADAAYRENVVRVRFVASSRRDLK